MYETLYLTNFSGNVPEFCKARKFGKCKEKKLLEAPFYLLKQNWWA